MNAGFNGGLNCGLNSGLVWGFDFIDGKAEPVIEPELGACVGAGALRWLHFNVADHRTHRWIEASGLPKPVRDLLLSHDTHQRALLDGPYLACVLHDFEREFGDEAVNLTGALRFVACDRFLLTVRKHPLRSADLVRRQISAGVCPPHTAAALDLLTGAIAEVQAAVLRELQASAERAEDELLADHRSPDSRELVAMRRRAVQLHRMLAGLRAIGLRLEADESTPPQLLPVFSKFAQRIAALDHDISALNSQLRLLREELDLQAAQRTNRSLYVLSILSALMLPATFVTGLFGMNTGGLPWASSPLGTLGASLLAVGSAAVVYLLLRLLGFARL